MRLVSDQWSSPLTSQSTEQIPEHSLRNNELMVALPGKLQASLRLGPRFASISFLEAQAL